MTKIEKLKELLLTLRLKAMAEILEETLKKTQTDNLSPVDILSILASQELAQRQERLVKTRINQAQFPVIKTLDAFDFSFPKSINKSLILNLFDLHFIEEKGNVIIMGPPGTCLPTGRQEKPIWHSPWDIRHLFKGSKHALLPPLI